MSWWKNLKRGERKKTEKIGNLILINGRARCQYLIFQMNPPSQRLDLAKKLNMKSDEGTNRTTPNNSLMPASANKPPAENTNQPAKEEGKEESPAASEKAIIPSSQRRKSKSNNTSSSDPLKKRQSAANDTDPFLRGTTTTPVPTENKNPTIWNRDPDDSTRIPGSRGFRDPDDMKQLQHLPKRVRERIEKEGKISAADFKKYFQESSECAGFVVPRPSPLPEEDDWGGNVEDHAREDVDDRRYICVCAAM